MGSTGSQEGTGVKCMARAGGGRIGGVAWAASAGTRRPPPVTVIEKYLTSELLRPKSLGAWFGLWELVCCFLLVTLDSGIPVQRISSQSLCCCGRNQQMRANAIGLESFTLVTSPPVTPFCPFAAQQRPKRQPPGLVPSRLHLCPAGFTPLPPLQPSGRGDKPWPCPLSIRSRPRCRRYLRRAQPAGSRESRQVGLLSAQQPSRNVVEPSLVAKTRRVSCISSQTGSHSGGIGW